jgi:hypothetical protein
MADSIEQRDFFISFNSADLVYAQAIDTALRAAGFTTFYYPNDIGRSGNIPLWMENALMNSRRLLALCTPEYMADGAVYSEAERYARFWSDTRGQEFRLVLVELKPTEFKPLLSVYERIDAKGLTPMEAAKVVVATLKTPDEEQRRDAIQSAEPLPKIFNVPYPHNPNFTGRLEAMTSLQRSLRDGNAAVIAVAGMGGVGKTTLAAEYCHRFGGQYGGVWWVRAEQASVMLADIAALGQRLGISATDNIEADAHATLENIASRSEPWLMVYDNAPNADAVSKWLPLGSVRCLITSRFVDFDNMATVTQLDQWSNDVTTQYLLDRTGRNDVAGASRLAHLLGGLPIAAEQAAVFLKDRKGVSFDAYAADIARLISRRRDVVTLGDYPDSVSSMFIKSLETLKGSKYGEVALDVLRLCSFLSADRVDLNLLTAERTREVLPKSLADAMTDRFVLEDALATLTSLSLVRREHEQEKTILAFHPLLLNVVRDWMGPDGRVFWRDVAERLVKNDGIVKENESRDDTQFIPDDAEIDCDDLGRGVLAIALARRLHKIWCKLNISIDQSDSNKDRSIIDSSSWTGHRDSHQKKYFFDRDRDTARAAFVMHLDAPWGGGKTTFANFVAQVLNPGGREQAEWSFLHQRYGDINLGAIFLEDPPSLDAPVTAGGLSWPDDARRPWVTIRFNAWQMEHVSPPWWVFYQTIRKHCFSAILLEGRQPIERAPSNSWRPPSALSRIFLWCRLWVYEILWRLKNPKVVALLMTALVSTVTLAILYRFNIVHLSRGSGTENVSFNLGDGIGLMLAGLTTLSAVWGFGAIFTESIIPGSDTIGERLSLGSGDPFERFRRHFYQTMERVRRPVIVIVDDLDRCRPAVVVDLIRGIQTLLRSSRVVFAILGDRDWIERAFEAHHSSMSAVTIGPEQTFGARFVEKAFQMSFVLPGMSKEKQTGYVRQLLLDRKRSSRDSTGMGSDAAAKLRQVVQKAVGTQEAGQLDTGQILEQVRASSEATLLDPNKLEQFVNEELAIHSAASEEVEKEISHRLEPLAEYFPPNPRQIKRIINAVTIYHAVALQQLGLNVGNPRWFQLARWIIIMTEWPLTWQLLGSYPVLGDLLKSQEPDKMIANIVETDLPGSPTLTLQELARIRADKALAGLIEGSSDAGPAIDRTAIEELLTLTPVYNRRSLLADKGHLNDDSAS